MNLPGIGPVTQNPDGSFTALSGPYAGKQIAHNESGVFLKNDDGTLTVLSSTVPNLKAGQTLNAGGPGGATGFLTDAITKDNPIAGTVRAADDIAHGNFQKAGGDFTQGATYGTIPIGGDSVPDATKAVGKLPGLVGAAAGDAANAVGNVLNGLGVGGGAGPDGSDADAETARANTLADALGGQANAAGAQADTDRGLGGQTRAQQEDSIAGLTAAANGTAPSAAELQLKQQAGIDAARQYGLAAALQGNNPGAALRQASLGAAQVAGTTNQNAAINRANEQATARGQLATTLANVRSGDQGAVNTDVSQQNDLNQGQLTSQGQGVTSTGQKIAAKTAKYSADQVAKGAAIGAAGTLTAGLLSDKRAKKNIAKSSLADALGKEVHGVTFTYKPEVEEDDDPHFGILADALSKVMPGVVKKGPSGFKEVDTGHLTLGNTAILSELARRIIALEGRK